ncbi:MerR family transcriptional regulator [Acidaminobacter sp. JC074]|uniref:MerR family transcriptional regulator n=1 Tax=Acidaminobacter sp. JC074 TaxID=2530199 RepID=UPI001F107D5F|nr:MerR family transcriptional regulator [Acidaminobacter sp. JC074]
MYTIKKLASLAQISTRTLRYYDEINLLKPSSYSESGYRLYDEACVDLLQQIMFYKAMGLSLTEIKTLVLSKDFNPEETLLEHRRKLQEELVRISDLIENIDKTLMHKKGDYIMTDQEKFEGLKEKMIEENEEKYGKAARDLYGHKVDMANEKLRKMSKEEMDDHERLTSQMHETFVKAMEENDPSGSLAMTACDMHKKWLMTYWTDYSKEAHLGLVAMYVNDERFTTYYDKIKKGLADFILQAMKVYLK